MRANFSAPEQYMKTEKEYTVISRDSVKQNYNDVVKFIIAVFKKVCSDVDHYIIGKSRDFPDFPQNV